MMNAENNSLESFSDDPVTLADTTSSVPQVEYKNEKQRGVKLYKLGDLDGAISCWSKSIDTLRFILKKQTEFESTSGPDNELESKWSYFVNLYIELCSNMSLALLKAKRYRECIGFSEDVLEYDPRNLKAMLRIIQANIELCEYEEALKHCKIGMQCYPENTEFDVLKRRVFSKRSKDYLAQRKLMRNIFANLEHDARNIDLNRHNSFLFLILSKAWDLLKATRICRCLRIIFNFFRKDKAV